jgi:hypothetical protein
MCGDYNIPLKALKDAVTLSYSAIWTERLSKALTAQGRIHEMASLDGVFKSSGPASLEVPDLDGEDGDDYNTDDELNSLLSIAVIAARKKCFDCRDRMFGIYNLLPWYLKKKSVAIDYERDAAELFISAAKSFIEGGRCLDIISWPRWSSEGSHPHSPVRQIAIPSWVPDWSVPLEVIPYATEHGHWGPKRDPRESFERFSIKPFQVTDDHTLHVKGVVGQITATRVCPTLQATVIQPPSEAELNEIWLYLLQCYMTASGNGPSVLNIEDFMDCVAVQYKVTTDHFQEWIKGLSHEGTTLPAVSNFRLPFKELEWLGRVRKVQTYRTFFTFKWGTYEEQLSKGRVGWGMTATSVNEGDKLSIVPGCLVPVVLRSIQSGADEVVSDAYTDDQLVQDVLQGIHTGSILQEDISIR